MPTKKIGVKKGLPSKGIIHLDSSHAIDAMIYFAQSTMPIKPLKIVKN